MENDFLPEFTTAISDEIKEIEKSGQSSILLRNGKRIGVGCGFWYQFEVEYLPNIPPDTKCQLEIGEDKYDVDVVGYDENTLTIAADQELSSTIGEARLINGAKVLLELLIKRIDNNSTKANPLGERMMNAGAVVCEVVDDVKIDKQGNVFTESQYEAINKAVRNNLTFIWGPPGTGKTTVIAEIVGELLNRDRSVLLVSHTNTAVNGAIKKVDEAYAIKCGWYEGKSYPILRLGSGGMELEERLQLDSHIAVASHDLILEKEELQRQIENNDREHGEKQLILSKNNWICNSGFERINELIDERAKIIDLKSEIDADIDKIDDQIKNEILQHPECEEARNLRDKLNDVEGEINVLIEEKDGLKNEQNELNESVRVAKDEIAVFQKRREVEESLSNLFSVARFNELIEKSNRQLQKYSASLAKIEIEINETQNIIDKYESKSALGKFFSDKSSYERAKAKLVDYNKRKTEDSAWRNVEEKSLKSYREGLLKRMECERILQDLKPKETRYYWDKIVIDADAKLTRIAQRIKEVDNELADNFKKKLEIEYKLEPMSTFCQVMDKLQEQKDALVVKKTDVVKLLNDVVDRLALLVSDESKLCSGFYVISRLELAEDYEQLMKKREEVIGELVGVDVEKVQTEIQALEGVKKELESKIDDVNNRMSIVASMVIGEAKVIGTTLAKSYLSDEIQGRKFDTVVLDEASMASIPALWCASQVAEKNIVIVGDFLQLPPIVLADTPMAKKWLGRDIFEVSGTQELYRFRNNRKEQLVVLNKQFRMEKEIANVANRYYGYYVNLLSDDKAGSRCEQRKEFEKWYNSDFEKEMHGGKWQGGSIHLVDTKNLNAWATGVPTGRGKSSRLNVFSGVLCVKLAFKLLEKDLQNITEPVSSPKVLIVAPYKPHVKRVEQTIKDEYRALGFPGDMNLIKVGTIHSFQGQEADVVIFDIVVEEPHHKSVQLFMNDPEVNEDLKRMFNVAVTRARFRLFMVGNFGFCKSHSRSNALGDLLKYLMEDKKYPLIDAKKYFPDMTYTRPTSSGIKEQYLLEVCREIDFLGKLEKDIAVAKERVTIFSPFMTENAMGSLLPILHDAVAKGLKVAVVTKTVEEVTGGMRVQKEKCEQALAKHGAVVVHKKNMHEKLVFVDNDIVWIGSLNVLSYSGHTGEVMCKIANKEAFRQIAEVNDLDYLTAVLDNDVERKCPACGKDLIMAYGSEYGYYWKCIGDDCGWTRKMDEPYPVDGIMLCPKCGVKYKLKLGEKPRWVCPEDGRHYCYVKKGHLKLEKMWEGVSRADKRSVERSLGVDNNGNIQLNLF